MCLCCAGSSESTACPSFRQNCTADTASRPNAPRDPAPTALFANVQAVPGGECNSSSLRALRNVPGQRPKRLEASYLRAILGQHVLGNLGTSTGGSSGESLRDHIARGPASTGASTPEDHNKHMSQKQSRAFCGTLEIQASVRFIKPGTLVAIYAPLSGDKITYRNGSL